MSIIAHVATASAPCVAAFWRFVDRVIAGREAHVAAELKHHSHLLPRELDQVAWKLSERSEDSLPFVR